MTLYLGIDPGSKGGICWLGSDGLIAVRSMPKTFKGRIDLVAFIPREAGERRIAYMELVSSFGQGSKSAFTFGKWVAAAECALIADRGWDYVYVVPQEWQAGVGFVSKAKGKDRKRELRDYALAAYPEHVPRRTKPALTLEVADSFLIASYCMKQCGGAVPWLPSG